MYFTYYAMRQRDWAVTLSVSANLPDYSNTALCRPESPPPPHNFDNEEKFRFSRDTHTQT